MPRAVHTWSPEEQKIFERAERLDPELFVRRSFSDPTALLIWKITDRKDHHPPGLDRNNPVSRWSRRYYSTSSERSRAESVRWIRRAVLYPDEQKNFSRTLKAGSAMKSLSFPRKAEKVVDKTIRYVLERFGALKDPNCERLKMKIGGHYLVEHSLHATQVMAAMVANPGLGAVVAALCHDLLEDVFLSTDDPEEEWLLAAYPPNWQSVMESASKRLVSRLSVDDGGINREVILGIDAMVRLTRNPRFDYEMNFGMSLEDMSGLKIIPPGYAELVDRMVRDRERTLFYVVMAKAADRISGLLTIGPDFPYRNRLKLYGKSWLVLNQICKFIHDYSGHRGYDGITNNGRADRHRGEAADRE